MINIQEVQHHLTLSEIDAWLVYDFLGNNPVFPYLAGKKAHLTERCFLFIPQQGQATFIVHPQDLHRVAHPDFELDMYVNSLDLHHILRHHLNSRRRIAMEYTPAGQSPTISWIDPGTVEFVKAQGIEVVPSEELFQRVAKQPSWLS